MSILAPVYSGPISSIATIANVRGLAPGYGFYTGPFDMSAIRAMDCIVSLDLSVAATSAYRVDLGLLVSPDGTEWPNAAPTYMPDTTVVAGWNQALQPIASLNVDSNAVKWSGALTRFIGTLPQYFALYVYNNTNAAFDAAYMHRVYVNFVQYEYV